jgi:hypothetical protein
MLRTAPPASTWATCSRYGKVSLRAVVERSAAMAAAPSGPGPVEVGQLAIVVSVEMRYRIAPR